ncbi:DoxX family protein [Croceitalea marina]|uniref:DoxX family protein n=1 Tax=Croceitalea marina TaxID=1775166 RepID=A0ABW5MXC7_9FLAO
MVYANFSEFSTSLTLLIGFSALSFLGFGVSCLTTSYMVNEFRRYGLSKFRILNGYIQIVASLALLAGFYHRSWAIVASAGLVVLMVLGFAVRMKIRDGIMKSLPALFYLVLNLIILIALLNH